MTLKTIFTSKTRINVLMRAKAAGKTKQYRLSITLQSSTVKKHKTSDAKDAGIKTITATVIPPNAFIPISIQVYIEK